MREDDLALLVEDYFTSRAAREDMEAVMITLPRHPNFSKNQARCKGDIQPCIVCGRPCNNPKWMLHIWYGDEVVSESDAVALIAEGKEGGDLGLYPVGSNCLHDHPQLKLYAVKPSKQPAYEPAPWSDEMQAQYEEEWSNADDRFIRPAVDLDRQASALLDEIYGEEF